MHLKNSKGITLIENLVAILWVSLLLVSMLGAFFVSRVSTVHARHRMVAMSLAREMLEKEMSAGYGSGGYNVFNPDTDSERLVDGVTYRIYRYPETPPTLYEGDITGIPYTTKGFKVEWTENLLKGTLTCSEKAVTHVSRH